MRSTFATFATWPALLLTAGLASAQSIDSYNPLPEGTPTSVAAEADGKMLIVGSFSSVGTTTLHGVARLDADGSVDPTFADPGANSEVKALAVQPDGKILIAGGFTEVAGQPRHGLARLDADGTLDTGFGDPDFNSNVWAIAVQPDGRILAAGDFTMIGTHAQNYFARLNAAGEFDSSFADPLLCCLPTRSVALQSDGRVVIGGFFSQAGGSTHFYLARYSGSGVFDPSFPNLPGNVPITGSALVVAPDDSVFVSGVSAQPVVKLHADGSYDPTFVAAATDDGIEGMTLQPNGKVLIGGIFQQAGGQPRHALARLNSNGTLDTTFGDLHFSFDAGNPNGYVYGLAAQADGRIVAVGNFTLANNQPRQYMARVVTGDYATHVLVVRPNGSQVDALWYRLGDGPELDQPPLLLQSNDGTTFSAIGPMTRIADGWQASANHDVHGARFYLQALGTTSNGGGNGSPGQVASEVYSNDTIFGWGFE